MIYYAIIQAITEEKELAMFNYLHKKFYTKYGHVLAAIFISLPTYLKHSEPEKNNKTKIQYWKQK